MPPMNDDAESGGRGRPTWAAEDLRFVVENEPAEAPIRRWVMISRDGSYMHVFVGPRGTVSKGPATLLGASFHDLMRHLGTGHGAVYPPGYVPVGYERHPSYRTARVAALRPPTPHEVARGLAEALDQAPLAPWVRIERQAMVMGARAVMRQANHDLALTTNGTVDATMVGQMRDALGAFPVLHRALWRAAQHQFQVIGLSPRALPEVVERELRARTRGAFIVNRRTAYVFVPNLRDVQDARSTAMEEMAHGLDVILGLLHGLEGVAPGRLPAETIMRSSQADFRALWERRKDRSTITRRVRQDARELFAYAFVRYYTQPATLKADDAPLYRFVQDRELEMGAYVGPP